MNSETQLSQLKSIVNQCYDLVSVIGLLHWDLETIMPAGGSAGRGTPDRDRHPHCSRNIHLR